MSELIEDIAMGPFGSDVKVDTLVDEGIPFLSGSNVTDFKLNDDNLRFIDHSKYDKFKKAMAKRGDIIITHRGTLGQIVFIPETSRYPEYIISQSQFRVRVNEKVIPQYLVYFFHSRLGQHILLSNASRVGVPALARPTTTFKQLRIPLPDLETQNACVRILDSIQNMIEVNTRINDYLSQIIDALVNHFNPLCSNSSLEEWCEYRMDDLVDCISGYAYSSTELVEESNTALTTIKNFDRAGGFKESGFKPIKISKEPKDGQFLDLFDIVVAHTDLTQAAEIIGNAELILTKGQFDKLVMSSDLVKLVSKRKEVNTFLLSALLKQKSFKDHALRYTSGTTVLHLSKKCIPEYCIILPTDLSQVGQICDELQSCYKLISKNLEMNNRLKSIREMLLSKMITP